MAYREVPDHFPDPHPLHHHPLPAIFHVAFEPRTAGRAGIGRDPGAVALVAAGQTQAIDLSRIAIDPAAAASERAAHAVAAPVAAAAARRGHRFDRRGDVSALAPGGELFAQLAGMGDLVRNRRVGAGSLLRGDDLVATADNVARHPADPAHDVARRHWGHCRAARADRRCLAVCSSRFCRDQKSRPARGGKRAGRGRVPVRQQREHVLQAGQQNPAARRPGNGQGTPQSFSGGEQGRSRSHQRHDAGGIFHRPRRSANSH